MEQLVFGDGFVLVGIGLLAGVAASLAASRLMVGLLYDVSAVDPAAFAFAKQIGHLRLHRLFWSM